MFDVEGMLSCKKVSQNYLLMCFFLKLIIVRQKDTLEQFFRPQLVEDKNLHSGAASYVDFLFQLHHEIRSILS
jgi:hypothetical protein